MKIQDYIDRLREDPKAFRTLGKGAHCYAVFAREKPNQVLLLEAAKPSSDNTKYNPTTDRAHARAVTFARQYDGYISAGVSSITNNTDTPFTHSDLLESIDPRKFGEPIPLYIGNGKHFYAASARLVRRIPGKALHYLDFQDGRTVNKFNIQPIAKDIALWLFTLHHQVSPGAMVGNKIEKQFADIGKSITTRAFTSEKFQVLVEQNLDEIRKLSERMDSGKLHPEFEKKLRDGMSAAGINFGLLAEAAEMLAAHLKKVLPKDRMGLTHSDVHPGNVIVSNDYRSVTGLCDWMSGGIDAQSVDFAGIGLAKGLLPRVVREYKRLEQDRRVSQPINYEAIYAYAAMRQIFMAVKAVKNDYGEGSMANVAWQQVSESVTELSRINTRFGMLARKMKHQHFPPVRAERTVLSSHPAHAVPAPT